MSKNFLCKLSTVMTKVTLVLALGLLTYGTNVVEAGELNVSNVFRASDDYIAITVANTAKDQYIVCVLYDATGKALASETQYADNLATQVLVPYSGKDVASARCADN